MTVPLALDHLVVSAATLDDGVAYVEERLGIAMSVGGKHPLMSTHNRLLHLGDAYLEVIAADPDAPAPPHPRWFDLDNFSGPPRLTNWVAQTPNLQQALAIAPAGSGVSTLLTRDDLTWHIALSEDGTLPFGGAFPGLIDWGDTPHPVTRLLDQGLKLAGLTVSHPDASNVADALRAFDTPLSDMVAAGAFGFRAEIQTPDGLKVLE